MRQLGHFFCLVVCVLTTSVLQANESEGKGPGLTVVCFGDSLTGSHPDTRSTYTQHYVKYSDMLQLLLEGQLGVGQVQVINSGWAGDRTTPAKAKGWPGAVGRLQQDVLDFQPDIAVVLIGGNDNAQKPEEIQETQQNLLTIFQQLKEAQVKVLALQYPPAMPAEEHAAKAWHHLSASANPLIAAAAEEAGVPVLDLGPAMRAEQQRAGRRHLVDDKDGVHLRPGGELVFARAIFVKMQALGWLQ